MAIVETESAVSRAIAAPALGQIKSPAAEIKDAKDSIPGVEGKLCREIRDTDLGLREADKDLREEIKDVGAGLRKEIRDLGAEVRAEIRSMARYHVIVTLSLVGVMVGLITPLIIFVLTRLD